MLTTLAGLLAAISGMYLAYNLKRQQQKLVEFCIKQWKTDENKTFTDREDSPQVDLTP
ncbi:hypothetical protein [Vibrio fortis]|uniref:hypothetical protein n=1 Tax=Vibrio fortis TaxID=212667 RepID=UPI0021E683B5|nr:hypothetical protein [Vibrio fortis]